MHSDTHTHTLACACVRVRKPLACVRRAGMWVCVCMNVRVCGCGGFLNANSYIEYQFSGHFLLLRLWGNVLRIRTANLQLSKRNLEFTKVRKLSHYHTLIFVDIW